MSSKEDEALFRFKQHQDIAREDLFRNTVPLPSSQKDEKFLQNWEKPASGDPRMEEYRTSSAMGQGMPTFGEQVTPGRSFRREQAERYKQRPQAPIAQPAHQHSEPAKPHSWQERFILLAHNPATGELKGELIKHSSQHEFHEIRNQVNKYQNHDLYVVPVSHAARSEPPHAGEEPYKLVRMRLERSLRLESGQSVPLGNLKQHLHEEHLAKRAGVPAVKIHKDLGVPMTPHINKQHRPTARHH